MPNSLRAAAAVAAPGEVELVVVSAEVPATVEVREVALAEVPAVLGVVVPAVLRSLAQAAPRSNFRARLSTQPVKRP